MHEFSLASALKAQIEIVAREHGMARVKTVEIEVGVLRLVVPEVLDTAFSALIRGTTLEGARLVQREIVARGRCRACGRVYGLAIDCYACPGCRAADVEIVEGNDIILNTVSGPARDEEEEGDEDPGG